jgi:hypothetical protein
MILRPGGGRGGDYTKYLPHICERYGVLIAIQIILKYNEILKHPGIDDEEFDKFSASSRFVLRARKKELALKGWPNLVGRGPWRVLTAVAWGWSRIFVLRSDGVLELRRN